MRYYFPVSTVDAIVPAGGTIDAEFAQLVGTQEKALIEIGGRSILQAVVQALRDSGRIRNIVVVGSSSVREQVSSLGVECIEPGDSGPENIFRGFDKLQQLAPKVEQALIVTCDLPFVSGESVASYLDLCPPDRDICVPVIDREAFEAAYPGTTSTFVQTKDGTFTIGGMFLMSARKLPQLRQSIEQIFAKRKSKIGMAMLIGPKFVWKYLTKSLTISDLEAKIESMLRCTGAAVRGAPVDLAYDIDYRDDYEYALKVARTQP